MRPLNPYKALYNLSEAAQCVGCVSDDLLRHAVIGNLRLCVKVPDDSAVFSLRKSLLDARPASLLERTQSLFVGWSREAGDVEILFLTKPTCRQIEALSGVTETIFDEGGKFDTDFSQVRDVIPGDYASPFDLLQNNSPESDVRVFAVYSRLAEHRFNLPDAHSSGRPISFRLHRDDLLVTSGDLERLGSQASMNNHPAADVRWPGELPDYMSYKLQAMREASREWISLHDKEKPEAIHELVIEKLKAHESFFLRARLASDAASLIRPISARRVKHGHQLPPLDQAVPSPELKALIATAELWKNYRSGKYPNDMEVRGRLQLALGARFAMSDMLGRQGPAILRPESTENHRHKQLSRKQKG